MQTTQRQKSSFSRNQYRLTIKPKSWHLLFLSVHLIIFTLFSFPTDTFSAQKITVATFSFAPLISTDETGLTAGINAELLEKIAEDNGLKISYRFGSWQDGLDRAKKNEVDLLTSVMYTEERDQYLDYTQEPIFTVWGGIYALPESEINSILDLKHRKIAIMAGDANAQNFQKLAQSFDLDCQYVEVPDHQLVFQFVKQGDAFAGVAPNIFGLLHAPNHTLAQTPVIFSPKPLYFAAPQGTNPEVLETIDRTLDHWKKDPTSFYYQTLDRWLSAKELKHYTLPTWVLPSLIGIASLILFLFLWGFILKKQVRRRTRELSEQEQKVSALYDHSPDMYVSVSPEDASILRCNETLAKKLGYSKTEIIGRGVFDLYHPDCRTEAKKTFKQFQKTGEVRDKNLILKKKDGSPLDVSLNVSSVRDSSGKILYSISSWRDISERVKAEEEKIKLENQLHQSRKVEALGRLAGGVAHDYNNMLSVIIGNLELVKMKVDPSAPVHRNLDQILNAANRSRDITQQLLAFARKQIISPVVLDVNTAMEKMLKMLHNLLGENIDLIWHPKEDVWPVKIDPSQLDQILINLCINARDAIIDTGKMTIETENIRLDEEYCENHTGFVPGDYIILAVSDNGCGMESETLKNVFEPFFSTKKTGEGTGLGLATVFGIVKQSKGFINAYSEPGQGSTFKIYLPRCDEEPEREQQTLPSEVQQGHGETILLTEDEVSIITLVSSMLGELNYKVLTASSPVEALSLAESHQGEIDLLITDVVMPEMNGRELATKLQGLYPEINCLFMSGYTANVIAHHGVLDDGINFIHKPFSRVDLSVMVKKALDSDKQDEA